MEDNTTVGKCKHCGDPIYKFQVVAHEGCVKGYEFNPDYLDFQKGVEAGRVTGKLAGIKEVVDWVDEDLEYSSAWQAKKKEWGL